MKNGGQKRVVTVSAEGKEWRKFDIELGDAEADWWAPLDIGPWKGKPLIVSVDKLPDSSKALELVEPRADFKGAGDLYREALRSAIPLFAQTGLDQRS